MGRDFNSKRPDIGVETFLYTRTQYGGEDSEYCDPPKNLDRGSYCYLRASRNLSKNQGTHHSWHNRQIADALKHTIPQETVEDYKFNIGM